MRTATLAMIGALSFCAGGAGCRSTANEKAPGGQASASAEPVSLEPRVSARSGMEERSLSSAYTAALEQARDLEYPGLERELGIVPRAEKPLPFRVASAKYFALVQRVLKLTRAETFMLTTNGVVSVNHQQRYSMASAYASIYGRDLPVLITTDSILHALHRSYDRVLVECETEWFSPVIRQQLEAVQGALEVAYQQASTEPARQALRDVDVYVSVALGLLAGAGAPPDELAEDTDAARPSPIATKLVGTDAITPALNRIAALVRARITLNGGKRAVDFGQFRVRGHYTKSAELRRYFRALMWLSRADLGFILKSPPAGAEIDVKREQRAAATLSLLLEQTQQLEPLNAMSDAVDFLVGSSDDFNLRDLVAARRSSGFHSLHDLGDEAKLLNFERSVALLHAAGRGQIRSQHLRGSSAQSTPIPAVFQVFGQRFVLDSFLLSRLVYDSIQFRGERPERMIPSGLDVMAALGNDTALQLQRSELERHKYSGNLLAARRVVNELSPESWRSNVYSLWLDALRTLSTPRKESGALPEVMRRSAWQKKQLTTQMASWAELRHDTILYAKQSYSAVPGCGYPDAYVEPYPEFFERLERLAVETTGRLRAMKPSAAHDNLTAHRRELLDQQASFFERFGGRMAQLRQLAEKELRSEPFTQAETDFLKQTIDRTMIGSGAGVLAYTGWYAQLFYGGDPAAWKPTVADVHTAGRRVLTEAVGDAHFLVVAVDNQEDRAVYVGPVYSHYEFEQPVEARLRDEEFARMIEQNQAPPRPAWTNEYQAPAYPRVLADIPPKKRRH